VGTAGGGAARPAPGARAAVPDRRAASPVGPGHHRRQDHPLEHGHQRAGGERRLPPLLRAPRPARIPDPRAAAARRPRGSRAPLGAGPLPLHAGSVRGDRRAGAGDDGTGPRRRARVVLASAPVGPTFLSLGPAVVPATTFLSLA